MRSSTQPLYAQGAPERLDALPDADLVPRVQRQDNAAREVLLHRHAEDLYRFCCYLVADRHDAEDICQESLARAIDRIDSLERGGAFRVWLFRIARNLAVDLFRQRRRTTRLPDDEAAPPPLQVPGPQEAVLRAEDQQTALRALGQLAQRQQTALVLREVEGLSYAAIGQQLHLSHSAVETLLYRARRRLRDVYHDHP